MDYGSFLIDYVYPVDEALSAWVSSWLDWWVAMSSSFQTLGILLSGNTGLLTWS